MKDPKLIYVAGPYTGKTASEQYVNIHDAWWYGAEVAKLGGMPVIPHTNTAWMDGLQPYAFWLRGTRVMLDRCDAALFVPRWVYSQGAVTERARCEETGKPIFDTLEDLGAWLIAQEVGQ